MSKIEYPVLLWIMLAIAFCIILLLDIFESNKLKVDLQKQLDADFARQIVNFMLAQSVKFFTAILLFFLLIAWYDWQIRDLRVQLQQMQTRADVKNIIDENKITAAIPADQNHVVPIVEKLENAPPQNSIQDIFGVKSDTPTPTSATDNIKVKYEELLVNYLLMQKCEKTNQKEYHIIMSALQKEITTANAPQNLQNDIITAAKGSYDELYSQSSCTDPAIESAAATYHNYVNSLLQNIGKR